MLMFDAVKIISSGQIYALQNTDKKLAFAGNANLRKKLRGIH